MAEVDVLWELRNRFYIGAFNQAIEESYALDPSTDTLKIERDVLLYRSHIGLGNYSLVVNEINDSSPTALLGVKVLASYLQTEENRVLALETLRTWLSDSEISATNATLRLVAGMIFSYERNYAEALKCVHEGTTLEMQALKVQILLKMDRLGLAEKELQAMQQQDDDHTLTQMAAAWVNIALGGPKVQDAVFIFQELIERFTPTPTLLNGIAVCYIQQKKFDEAERVLTEALGKNPNHAETLINRIVCMLQQRKPIELVGRYVSQLKTQCPKHPWIAELTSLEAGFDRLAVAMKPM